MNAFAKNLTKDVVFDFLKGLLIASILSLGMIVLFAFCMKWFDLSDVFIAPIVLGIMFPRQAIQYQTNPSLCPDQ